MADPQDKVDIPGIANPNSGCDDAAPTAARPWLGIFFNCCHVYGRIYRDGAGRRYSGKCPRCGTEVHASVGPGGTARRFFETT
ncbi:MAG: hypothetical protein AAFX05_06920 [Planctomycetota bacterium]